MVKQINDHTSEYGNSYAYMLYLIKLRIILNKEQTKEIDVFADNY